MSVYNIINIYIIKQSLIFLYKIKKNKIHKKVSVGLYNIIMSVQITKNRPSTCKYYLKNYYRQNIPVNRVCVFQHASWWRPIINPYT